jgi:1,4-alpha-glucan branching enzyme
MILNLQRRFPIGAELQPKGGTHFRVWAPRPKKVEVLLEAGPGAPATAQLKQEADGYFAGLVPQAAQRELAELADCGITVLEVMPVADFPGRFG